MRRVLKPFVLAIIALALLWLMKDRDHDAPVTPDPVTVTVTASPAAPMPQSSTSAPTADAQTSVPSDPAVEPAGGLSSVGDLGEVEGEPVDPTAAAIPRDAAQASRFELYAQAASAFLVAFARPADGDQALWWGRVGPLLADTAQDAYDGVDARYVPFTAVTGPAVILPSDAPSNLLMVARVPTDAGWYRVEMTTVPEGIRVSRATPEGVAP